MLVYGSYIHTGGKSGGELLTLFDSYSHDGVGAAKGAQHTEVPNLGVACDLSWQLLSLWCECSYRGLTAADIIPSPKKHNKFIRKHSFAVYIRLIACKKNG